MSDDHSHEASVIDHYDPETAVSLGDMVARAELGIRKAGGGALGMNWNGTDWVVMIHFGVEMAPTEDDPGSDMVGGAAYGNEPSLYWALHNALAEANW